MLGRALLSALIGLLRSAASPHADPPSGALRPVLLAYHPVTDRNLSRLVAALRSNLQRKHPSETTNASVVLCL